MTATYDLIASNVLTSSASSVTFSSIPATYRDLVVVASVLTTTGGNIYGRINGDDATNYSWVRMRGDGASATSSSNTQSFIDWGQGADGVIISNFLDYSVTDKHKTFLIRSNTPSILTEARAYRWASTSAVNQITFYNVTFNAGSRFEIYGIAS